jgi:hypothetical protein
MQTTDFKERVKKATLFLSIGLYLTSLTQQCYCTESSCGDSIAAVISGVFGFFFGGAALTWLANPVLLYVWITINNIRNSLIASIFAFVLALSFLFFHEVISDEAGHYSKIISYRTGYWLWLASILTMTVGNCYRHVTSKQEIKAIS